MRGTILYYFILVQRKRKCIIRIQDISFDNLNKADTILPKQINKAPKPVLLYGATTWALTKTEERRLDAFEMGMLRSILGVRWDDFIRNDDIRGRLCQPPVSLKLRKARLKWFGHMERMGEDAGEEAERETAYQMEGCASKRSGGERTELRGSCGGGQGP